MLGAVLPFAASLAALFLGVRMVLFAGACSWWGGGLLLAGLLLAANGAYGLFLGLKSWPTPEGRQASAEENDALRAFLEASRASWKGPGVENVILDPNGWNLDLLGTPTLGMLGWARFNWVVGVYPLLALSTRELDAILSWEVVWWSGQQSWLNLQMKRLVSYWQQVHGLLVNGDATRKQLLWAGVLRSYTRWRVRLQEGFLVRECLWTDAMIAEEHGTSTYGRALCRLAILRPLMDRHIFPELLAALKAGQPMPENLYAYMGEALARGSGASEGILALALEGLVPQAPPLLRLRLLHLGVAAAVPMPPGVPAIRQLLDGTPALEGMQDALKVRILAQLDKAAVREKEGARRYREVGLLVADSFPYHPDSLEYLNLAFDRTPPEVFGGLLQAFRKVTRSRDPEAQFLLVKWLLREGLLIEAQAQIRELLLLNPFFASACHSLLGEYHRNRGDFALAGQEKDHARRSEYLLERAKKERGSASLGDSLEPHGCVGAQLDAMVSYLKALGNLGEAFLVRKKMALHPDHPVLLLVVRPQSGWWDPRGRKRNAIQARIARECPFPGRATGYVLVLGPGLLLPYRRRFKTLGALIL